MAKVRAHIPTDIPMLSSSGGPTSKTLQAVGDYMAVICQAEEDATITRVTGYVNARNGTPGTTRVGIQSVVTTTGLPSGTWLGSVDLTTDITNFPATTVKEWTLSSNATVTRGQYYAIVIQALSGSWSTATDNLQLYSYQGTGVGPSLAVFPYVYDVINGVAGTKTTTALVPCVGCGSSTTQYRIAHKPTSVSSWNSGSTPNQRGIKFKLPASSVSSFKIDGVRMAVGPTNSASTWDLNLYDASNNILQNRSFTNQEAYNVATLLIRDYYFDESTLTALSPNTDYRIAIQATSATLGCMTYIELASATDCTSAFIPNGTYCSTTRTGTGAWTDTTTAWFPMQLIIDDLTVSASGGGLMTHPGMAGGMRG
jgi:hypothetical protein